MNSVEKSVMSASPSLRASFGEPGQQLGTPASNSTATLIAYTGTSPGAPLVGAQDPVSSKKLEVLWSGSTVAMASQFADGEVRKLRIKLQNPLMIHDENRKHLFGDVSHARIVENVLQQSTGSLGGWDGIVFKDTADGMEVADVIVVFPREGSVDHAVEQIGLLTYDTETGDANASPGFYDTDEPGAPGDDEELRDQVHQAALDETGFWGRQAAGSIVLAKETGRVLLPFRSEQVLEPHTWGTWGGAMDADESPAAAARRELVEESGCKEGLELIPLLVFASGDFRYHNRLAIVDSEFRPKLNGETQGFIWTDPEHLPEPLHPGLKALIQDAASMQIIKAHASSAAMHAAAGAGGQPADPAKAPRWTGPAFRALNFNPPARASVADLLEFESEDLGNRDIRALGLKTASEFGFDLEATPASQAVWITKTREQAKQYGTDAEIREVKTDGWVVLVDLGEEGALLAREPHLRAGNAPSSTASLSPTKVRRSP